MSATPTSPPTAAPAAREPPARSRSWAFAIAIGVVVGSLIGATSAVVLWRHMHLTPLPASCAAIGCSDLGTGTSPDFTLDDQDGRTVSLAALRGKVVVLGFMDPVCVDICPIVSNEFARADRILGSDAANVEFVSVNVNQFHESTSAVRAFSAKHHLLDLPNWHFVTGTTDQLQGVWNDYHIAVGPNSTGDVVHTSILYFIDPSGRLRVAASPIRSKASIVAWAHSIADLVRWLQTN